MKLAALFLIVFALHPQADAQIDPTTVLPVTSPAFVFSPGNWTGDSGRGGKTYRQTWYPGAYFRVSWTTTSANPTATLLLDTSSFGDKIKNLPEITYNIDGVWTGSEKVAAAIPIQSLTGPGPHTLTVYLRTSDQKERWGTPQASGLNVLRISGLQLDRESKPTPAAPAKRWALIVGDSITEGSGADNGRGDNLASWSYFVGVGLQTLGYEYGISACGWSGWLRPGDNGGDVPPYYQISKATSSDSGIYDDTRSRWNKIDAQNSLLDAKKHLSAYGGLGQEPSAILINYGTNDGLSQGIDPHDLQASITQSLRALQTAAPQATIFVIVPFGQYTAAALKASVANLKTAGPFAKKIVLIDLGPTIARGLVDNGYWSGLHPNTRGHATFAAQILPTVIRNLTNLP